MRCRAIALSLLLVSGAAAALRSQAPPQPSLVFASPYSPPLTGMHAGGFPIAADGEGNSYIAGSALFSNFPITDDAAQRNASQMFVAKLDRVSGRIVWGTYLGGVRPTGTVNIFRDFINIPTAIEVDAGGNVWVAGWTRTSDFPLVNPVVSGPQGTAFVAKLNPRGSAILFSSYLGATPPFVDNTPSVALAVDAIGNAYVGLSDAQLRTAYETRDLSSVGRPGSLLVAKFNPAGGVVYATRFGSGGSDVIRDMAVDSSGAVHVIGTAALPSFPTLNAIVPQCPRVQNLVCNAPFVTKLDSTGSRLVYSTFLSGSTGNTTATSVAADFDGATLVTGTTTSTDFPLRQAHQVAYGGMGDGFLTKLGPSGSLVTSTYLGGGAAETAQHRTVLVDTASRPTVVGFTRSADVPALPGVEHPDAPLFQSRDGGVTWRPSTNGLVRNGVLPELSALSVTHTGPRVWYAGAADGVYVSIDEGASWQFSNEGLGANRQVCAIATDPAHADTVYAGTPSGTYKSEDRGQRWSQVYPGEFNCSVFVLPSSGLAVDGNGVVFATWGNLGSIANGLLRSSDGGRTWLDVSSGIAGAVRSIVFDPNVPGVVYAVSAADGLYRSTNGGSSWTRATGLPANTNLDSLAIVPGSPSRLYGQAFSDLLRSDDDGRTWTRGGRLSGRYITLQPGQREVLFAHHRDSQLNVTLDAGQSSRMVSNGLPDRVTAFAFDPRDANLAFAAASTRTLPLLLAFDQQASRVRVAGFLDAWSPLRVAYDPSGDLYISTTVNSQPTLVKLRMP